MATVVPRKFKDMEKIKILCLGNGSEDTMTRSQAVALQYLSKKTITRTAGNNLYD
jgi:hypothetical protein